MEKDNPILQRTARELVQNLMNTIPGMCSCVISTEDGLTVAAHLHNENSTRISAIAGSMASLGVVAAQESQLGACNNIMLEAEEGTIIMAKAYLSGINLVLSLVANKNAIIGQLLYAARDAAQRLEQIATA